MHRRPLTSTYRLQLHREFSLDRVREILPYLERLGISHVYSSPILAARAGSTHGYDVVDPARVNPELGGDEARRALVAALAERGMGLVLDIVPNHMGADPSNPCWEDVLTHGRASRYAPWFDVDWGAPGEVNGRVMVPVLGDHRASVIERDEISVVYDGGRFRVKYYDHTFPLDPTTAHRLFTWQHEYAFPEPGAADAMLRVRDALIPEGGAELDRAAAGRAVAELVALVERSPAHRAYVDWLLPEFARGDEGRYRLGALLDLQPYMLAFWRRAAREINYRRFFDINELVALRAEDPAVFAATHALVLGWVRDGAVQGLRVDHVDGILDPLAYLRRLRAAVDNGSPGARGAPAAGGPRADADGDFVPIYVEKILSPGEHLRTEWPVQGTTGYEVLNDLETLFLDPAGAAAVERTYRALLPAGRRARDFHAVAVEGKLHVLRGALDADVRHLGRRFLAVVRREARVRELDAADLRAAIVEFIAALGVYRTYVDARAGGPVEEDRGWIGRALAEARRRGEAPPAALDQLEDVLLLRDTQALGASGADATPERARAERLHVVQRLQQTSGPATAKGVEDTALYRYGPLLSRNEVGGDPTRPLDDALGTLHRANAERAARWPLALVCTNTHDTKRSADVRARIDVLTELPELWRDCVTRWSRAHHGLKRRLGRRRAPDVYSEYLLYQTLVGAWPLPPADWVPGSVPDAGALVALCGRIKAYMLKAVRESKSRTSWTESDEAFESALADFVDVLLCDDRGRPFREEVSRVVGRLARPGLWNALSRTLVHLAAPGTPDLYQGDELWNFSLVDPDNRRPVDYALRARLLADVERAAAANAPDEEWAAYLADMLARAEDGRVKLYLTWRALQARREWPAVFREGSYEPVAADGARARHLFAFARRDGGRAVLAVAPRLVAGLAAGGGAPVGDVWGDTVLRVPTGLEGRSWECLLTRRRLEPTGEGGVALPASAVLATFPVALVATDVGGAR